MPPIPVLKSEKEIISDFIILYQKRPCLWDIRSVYYNNKQIRLSALNELLSILKKLDPCANIISVRAKIDALRCNYKREKKKVMKSINSGCSPDKAHKPCLWYYNLLDFLPDNAEVRSQIKRDNLDTSMTGCGSEKETNEELKPEIPIRRMKRKIPKQKNTSITEKLNYHSDESMDEIELYGKMLSIELKRLEEPNRSIAQKLMSDVLFYAKMGRLTVDSTISIPADPFGYEYLELDDDTRASESD